MQVCSADEVAQVVQLPPVALNTQGTPQKSGTQNIWTAIIGGQPWGNGVYQVKTSSIWTAAYSQMWQLFDFRLDEAPHFRLYNYNQATGYSATINSLDGLYNGESYI
jgi:hypothetical protein